MGPTQAEKCLYVGTGGLGSPTLMYLAAGVGRIGIVDFDVVDELIYKDRFQDGVHTVGKPKVQSAKNRPLISILIFRSIL